MTQAFEIAGAGLTAQQRALDIIANNIANLNTQGFKRSDVRFSELISSSSDTSVLALTSGDSGISGVRVSERVALDAQGPIELTGNALDLAIQGRGFIEIVGPQGQTLLWRGGRLEIGPDGQLSAGPGLILRSMVNIPLDAHDLRISPDGLVSARSFAGEVEEIGQIGLVRVEDHSALERLDDGFYRVADTTAVQDVLAGESGNGQFVQGAVERSNVELNSEMVQLMIIQRAYAANAQIVQAADQLMSIANNLRR